jgi:riboflavin transporter FmnP
MKKSRTFQLVFMAMLSAIAVVLMILVRIPLIPATPFLIYDMADIPVLIGTMLGGIIPGLLVLLVTALIQAFAMGGDGWVGFVMHFISSGMMVVFVGIFHTCNPKWWKTALGLITGTLAMTAVMIPMNLILTPLFMGVPRRCGHTQNRPVNCRVSQAPRLPPWLYRATARRLRSKPRRCRRQTSVRRCRSLYPV